MSSDESIPKDNGAILTIAQIIKAVMSSSAEAELQGILGAYALPMQLRDRTIAEFVKVDGTIIKANFMTKLLNRVEFDHEYKRLAFIPETLETPPNDAEEDHERSATSDEV